MARDLSRDMTGIEWWLTMWDAWAVEKHRDDGRRRILDVTKRLPRETCQILVRGELARSRSYRRCMRSTFGYDPLRRQTTDPSKMPQTPAQSRRYWRLIRHFDHSRGLFDEMVHAFMKDTAAGGDGWDAVNQRLVEADRRAAWAVGRDAVLHPDDVALAEATAIYVGTLLARVNLTRNSRLARALDGATFLERHSELAVRFPGYVREALLSGSANDSPQTVLSRAVRYIEWESDPKRRHQSKERRHQRDGPPVLWPHRVEYDPIPHAIRMLEEGSNPEAVDGALQELGYGTLESLFAQLTPEAHARRWYPITGIRYPPILDIVQEFAAAEEAARVIPESLDTELYEAAMSLAEQACLAPRQAEIFALAKAGLKHREIANMLGISVGTSKPTLKKATAKIKAAVSQAG